MGVFEDRLIKLMWYTDQCGDTELCPQTPKLSIEIYHFFSIPHYCVPGTLFFPHCSVPQICLGGEGGGPPVLICILH